MPTTPLPKPPYFGNWSSWGQVSEDFTGWSWGETDRAKAIPEPEEVIFAGYDTSSYEGYAFVVFRQGDLFFTVEGSHCSCYGLEMNQWKPEAYHLPTLIAAMERMRASRERYDSYVPTKAHLDFILANLRERT